MKTNKISFLLIPVLILSISLIIGCKKDDNGTDDDPNIPVVATIDVAEITEFSAVSGGVVSFDGGLVVTARGVCWSISDSPTINDNKTEDGTGAGPFVSHIHSLLPETYYTVRAYATNSEGTAYGASYRFKTLDKWGIVYNPSTGRTWMDRNLGAVLVATSVNDSMALGDLYQWGRGTDGHEKIISGTTTILSSTDDPGHGDFILVDAEPNNWRMPQNFELWQGLNGINNPCPSGFRLPTVDEWDAERQSWTSNNLEGAFNSPLRLPFTYFRSHRTGSLVSAPSGYGGFYWSSSNSSISPYILSIADNDSFMAIFNGRAGGISIRCIKD